MEQDRSIAHKDQNARVEPLSHTIPCEISINKTRDDDRAARGLGHLAGTSSTTPPRALVQSTFCHRLSSMQGSVRSGTHFNCGCALRHAKRWQRSLNVPLSGRGQALGQNRNLQVHVQLTKFQNPSQDPNQLLELGNHCIAQLTVTPNSQA